MQAQTQQRIISRERGPLGGILGERSIQPKTMLMRACPLHTAYYPATETILRKEKFLFFHSNSGVERQTPLVHRREKLTAGI